MSVDERSRLQLAEAAKRAFGDDAGVTLMELLPPVGWADVATRHDVARVEQRLDRLEQRFDLLEQRFDELVHELHAQTWKLMALTVAMVGSVAAIVRL